MAKNIVKQNGNCKGTLLNRRRDYKIAKQHNYVETSFSKKKYNKRRRRDFKQNKLHFGVCILN